ASTGAPSIFASYNPFNRWMAPGPEVARQTPRRPVYFAYPHAMKAADSSCRTCTNEIESWRIRSASMMPLIPSPGRPKITRTPHSISRSASTSAAVRAIVATPSSHAKQEADLKRRLDELDSREGEEYFLAMEDPPRLDRARR